jgi:hypothetical protein
MTVSALRRMWTENRIPEDWYKGIIVPIYKMGVRKQCGNYKGIMLLCQTFKNGGKQNDK